MCVHIRKDTKQKIMMVLFESNNHIFCGIAMIIIIIVIIIIMPFLFSLSLDSNKINKENLRGVRENDWWMINWLHTFRYFNQIVHIYSDVSTLNF